MRRIRRRIVATLAAAALLAAPTSCSDEGGSGGDPCGNGVIEFYEECDDGNRVDGDGCSSGCLLEEAADADADAGDVPDADADADAAGDAAEADAPDDGSFVVPEAGSRRERLTVDGIARAYQIEIPATAVAAMAGGRVPFVIGLHGAGDTGANFIAATGLTGTAAANAFVLAGPDGYNRGWFVQSSEGWPGSDGYSSSMENDIAFLLQLVDVGYEQYGIDRRRVYAVGHSRGAGMTALLAVFSGQATTSAGPYESPFAAYGVNAGYDPTSGRTDMTAAAPKRPIWVIHGTADGVVPFSMGQQLADALEAAGWDVTFTSIAGGTHNWLWQRSYGTSNQELWDFLAAHPLP